MATRDEVEAAVRSLVLRLAEVAPDLRRAHVVERTVSCHVTDLDVVWTARLGEDGLEHLTEHAEERAQVRVAVTGDDLVALVDGRLGVTTAWASGRLRVQAGPLDLLRLRTLL